MTKSEGLVWHCILKNNKTGYRRLRQKAIGNYILDFYCAKLKLCIEIDGSSHDNKQDDDATRDYILYHDYEITTIRYTSEQVEYNLSGVFDDILERCQKITKLIGSGFVDNIISAETIPFLRYAKWIRP